MNLRELKELAASNSGARKALEISMSMKNSPQVMGVRCQSLMTLGEQFKAMGFLEKADTLTRAYRNFLSLQCGDYKSVLEGPIDGPPESIEFGTITYALALDGQKEEALKRIPHMMKYAENKLDLTILAFRCCEDKLKAENLFKDEDYIRFNLARFHEVPINGLSVMESASPYISPLHTGKSVHLHKANLQRKTPPLNVETLAENIKKVVEMVPDMDFGEFFDRLKSRPEGDPVQVISTGRCGTFGLTLALKDSPNVQPLHNFQVNTSPMDRQNLIHRYLTGTLNPEDLYDLFLMYLRSRVPELITSYRNQKRPMFINHWDVVFSPLLLGLFPKMKFIHLEREPMGVFRSQFLKNQWRYRQFFPCKYSFSEGFMFTREYPLEGEMAWFVRATECFAKALKKILPEDRFIHVSSKELFQGTGKLSEFMPDLRSARLEDGLPKTNSKDDFKMEVSEGEMKQSEGVFMEFYEKWTPEE